jgi:integrase
MTTSRALDAEIVSRLHEHRPDVFTPERNAKLWEEIPEGLRLVHFTRQSIPDEYRNGFGYYHDKIGNAHLDTLPEEMAREVAYVFWRTIEIGGRVAISPWGLCVRELGRTAERLRSEGHPCCSLMDRTPDEWEHELQRTWALRTGAIGNPNTLHTITAVVYRACKLLWFAYDDGPWWTREVWNLRLDPRIPHRVHEPAMEETIHWHRIEPRWLRLAGMWHMKAMLETNQLTWTSVIGRCSGLLLFADFLAARQITEPELMTDHQRVRPLMLDFLDELRTKPIERGTGRRIGEVRSDASTTGTMSAVRQLYRYLHDHREDAARVLGEPRWARLGPEHLRFLRDGDLPRRRARRPFDERHLISEAAQARVSAVAHMIGEPTDANGLGDPQAMRILLLLIATGRRRSEIRMLDHDPIIPVAAQPSDDGEVVAKLRYQQTKIEGAPNTIFVGADVAAIVAEQQRWVAEHMAAIGSPGVVPRYLFIRKMNNRHGRYAFDDGVLTSVFRRLVERFDLRDDDGKPFPLGQTHRWRHTKATSLINAGVPLHVVQRYMGHTTPEMTMHYAQTLDQTARAEFLRYRKLTRSGAPSSVDAEDLYDLLALDRRTDRVLPNGWCTLPPAKHCDKGNACLTCDLFVTDERFLPVHEAEMADLVTLIERRQADHRERTGAEMGENHVWLRQRRREEAALRGIIGAIEAAPESAPLQGAGVAARTELDSQARSAVGT